MSNYVTWWYKIWNKVACLIAAVNWSGFQKIFDPNHSGYNLTQADHEKLKNLLANGYYLILTQRKTHLSTYGVSFLTWIKTGKWPSYTHILMNLDLVENPDNFERFKLMEATSSGVHYSRFLDVFNCDSVCVMRPLKLEKADWDIVMAGLAKQLGKAYDNLFDIRDGSRVSCVEMVLDSLRYSPTHYEDFAELEAMIAKVDNLTPQMYRDCSDFEVIFEVKR